MLQNAALTTQTSPIIIYVFMLKATDLKSLKYNTIVVKSSNRLIVAKYTWVQIFLGGMPVTKKVGDFEQ